MAIKPARQEKPALKFPKVMLAPIAGVSDRPMRQACRIKGCPLTFSELISARGLQMKNGPTCRMLEQCRDEHPLVIQIFGNSTDCIYDATRMVDDLGADGINLNLGCPVKKVFKSGSGCGLTIFPVELVSVLRAMRKATDKHLSVKIRAGVNLNSLNYRLIGDIAQGEGIDAVIFHARTRAMGFGGHAQWHWIADLKDYLDIPVIGNGNVTDPLSAKAMLDQTGCDGVMIGRGAYGKPWIFKDVLHYWETGALPDEISFEERVESLIRHLYLAVEWLGPRRGVFEMRKQVGWYLKGLRTVKILRQRTNYTENVDETVQAVREWAENYCENHAAQSDERCSAQPVFNE